MLKPCLRREEGVDAGIRHRRDRPRALGWRNPALVGTDQFLPENGALRSSAGQ